jgi:hypothetical protein
MMLFKGEIHLNASHNAGEKAAKQVYSFPEPSGHIF